MLLRVTKNSVVSNYLQCLFPHCLLWALHFSSLFAQKPFMSAITTLSSPPNPKSSQEGERPNPNKHSSLLLSSLLLLPCIFMSSVVYLVSCIWLPIHTPLRRHFFSDGLLTGSPLSLSCSSLRIWLIPRYVLCHCIAQCRLLVYCHCFCVFPRFWNLVECSGLMVGEILLWGEATVRIYC